MINRKNSILAVLLSIAILLSIFQVAPGREIVETFTLTTYEHTTTVKTITTSTYSVITDVTLDNTELVGLGVLGLYAGFPSTIRCDFRVISTGYVKIQVTASSPIKVGLQDWHGYGPLTELGEGTAVNAELYLQTGMHRLLLRHVEKYMRITVLISEAVETTVTVTSTLKYEALKTMYATRSVEETSTSPSVTAHIVPTVAPVAPPLTLSLRRYAWPLTILATVAVAVVTLYRIRSRPAASLKPKPKPPAEEGAKYCAECGARLRAEAKFCDECGAKQE